MHQTKKKKKENLQEQKCPKTASSRNPIPAAKSSHKLQKKKNKVPGELD